MNFSQFNKTGVHFDIETEGMDAIKAAEVYSKVQDAPLIMKGIFINKDNGMGESVSVVTPNHIIYFGTCNVETARMVRESPDAVKVINESGAWFKIREFYVSKFKKNGYAFVFLDDSEIPAEADLPKDAPCFKW